MKLLTLLAAAPLATAFVVPDQQVFAEIATEEPKKPWSFDRVVDSVRDEVKHVGSKIKTDLDNVKDVFHSSLDSAFEAAHGVEHTLTEEAFDTKAWIQSSVDSVFHPKDGHHDHPPHGRPPHDGPPHDRPHRGGPHKKHPHHKPDKTIYELIASSKYTTKLAKTLEDYPDLIQALNGTKANYTVFAPTDAAFDKIPKDAPKPSKEFLKKILQYHVSDHFYPAGRVLHTYTIPTLLEGDELGDESFAQRLAIKLTLRGLTLNYYARIVAVDIFASNGVIHGLDSFVLPPPRTLKIIDLLPSSFSTFELALTKTGLLEDISKHSVKGGTLFVPDNFAFAKLGPGLNAFLFSPRGLKYLKAILKYHFVPKTTLYSDALYISTSDDKQAEGKSSHRRPLHLDLPTLLEDHSLSVDVGRFGPFVGIHVNGFTRVTAPDGVARDGVLQVVNKVLVPPRNGHDGDHHEHEEDAEISVEELKARLEKYVD